MANLIIEFARFASPTPYRIMQHTPFYAIYIDAFRTILLVEVDLVILVDLACVLAPHFNHKQRTVVGNYF